MGLSLGIIVALLAVNQFVPIKFFAQASWPFYPAWTIFLLAIINLALLVSERFFFFPSNFLSNIFNNNKPLQEENVKPLTPILIFSLAALAIALPMEFMFFTAPVRFQTLDQLANGPAGFTFLDANVPKEALVLSDPVTSFYLPAYSKHNPI